LNRVLDEKSDSSRNLVRICTKDFYRACKSMQAEVVATLSMPSTAAFGGASLIDFDPMGSHAGANELTRRLRDERVR
jgi:hypothetical protein